MRSCCGSRRASGSLVVSRVVTSLNEYYVPADQRLYRSGQG